MRALRSLGVLACAAGLLAAMPAGAGANVQVGSSGWQWGNPLPQGNTIRAMSFAGQQGYAAGDFGTLLSTSDGGATWTGLLSGTHANLTEVQAIDSSAMFAGGGCVARRSDDGGKTFKRVAFSPVESSCPQPIAAAWFVNRQTGYLVLGDGTVERTDNNGATFSARTALPGTQAQSGGAKPNDIVFTTPDTGVAATTDGKLYRTTDGASSWALVGSTGRAVRNVVFLDASTGYAVGDGSVFLKTTDGGATWNAKAFAGASANLTSIRCATAGLCVMTTEHGDQLVRTADGGDTATLVTPSTDAVHAAAFASATRVVFGGELGSTATSDDAGVKFAPVGGRLAGTFNAVIAGTQAGTAFAPGNNGTLAKTTDAGRTWTRGNVPTSEGVLDVAFPSASIGYALDFAGGLFRTDDGGQSWKTLDTGSTARPRAVAGPSSSIVLVIGPTGIRRSTDGGQSFDAVTDKRVKNARLFAIDRAGSTLVVYGTTALARSSDKGKTWTAIARPGASKKFKGYALRDVDFLSAKTGFALASTGKLYRTTDSGKHWTALLGTGTGQAYGLSMSSTTRGYLVINRFGDVQQPSGFLLRTTDGGATWHPQFVVSTPLPGAGVAAGAGGTDYLLGGQSSLLFTTVGGDAGASSSVAIKAPKATYKKPASITVTGRLKPAAGNERVTVSYLAPGTTFWRSSTVKVASNGSFTTSWRLRKGTNTFVAQWPGDFRSKGAGSKVLSVRVG